MGEFAAGVIFGMTEERLIVVTGGRRSWKVHVTQFTNFSTPPFPNKARVYEHVGMLWTNPGDSRFFKIIYLLLHYKIASLRYPFQPSVPYTHHGMNLFMKSFTDKWVIA